MAVIDGGQSGNSRTEDGRGPSVGGLCRELVRRPRPPCLLTDALDKTAIDTRMDESRSAVPSQRPGLGGIEKMAGRY
ncbi:tubulin-specific chaperone A-like protein [Labeo rohita]|uniref:Tubulin-specific chaperone A-like protein n=1 Tax=Labeo rohita TaxID=84645 RepID=A0A498NND9_LABRO|nr:tubulin-specific chaperone A-like protein [Labeo rohita]